MTLKPPTCRVCKVAEYNHRCMGPLQISTRKPTPKKGRLAASDTAARRKTSTAIDGRDSALTAHIKGKIEKAEGISDAVKAELLAPPAIVPRRKKPKK